MLSKLCCYWGHPPYSKLDDVRDISAIALVPFGTRRADEPNEWSNAALAEAARKYSGLLPGVKFLLQWEFAYEQLPYEQYEQIVGSADNPHISTWAFFARLAAHHPFATIGILAHPAHAWRSKWIAEKMGFRVFVLDPGQIPFSPGNMHWQVRNSIFYFFWERLSRFHHALKGWI